MFLLKCHHYFKPRKQIFVKAPVSYKPLFVLLLLFSVENKDGKHAVCVLKKFTT